MDFKRIFIFFIGFSILSTIGAMFFVFYIGKTVSDPGKMDGIFKKMGISGLGKQAVQWESGMFSPDGKYYVYTYKTQYVLNYDSRRGSQVRYDFYLQVLDVITGEKLLDKAFESKEDIQIVGMSEQDILLWSYVIGKNTYSPAIFSLNTKAMKFSTKALRKLNPEVPIDNVNSYFQSTNGKFDFRFTKQRRWSFIHGS